MVVDGQYHARRIRQAVERPCAQAQVNDAVVLSWRRCLEDYGLDPASSNLPPVLTRPEFLERYEQAGRLLQEAMGEMELLYQQLGDAELAVVLVDREGTILHMVAKPTLNDELGSLHFRRGAIWSERFAGSNGMGTCLATVAPILIQTTDHFFPEYTALTCSAMPIFGPEGELVAALNVTGRSGVRSPASLALIEMTACVIENRLLDALCTDALSLYFHPQAECVNMIHAGKLMVSADNRIVAANRNAKVLLGLQHMSELYGRQLGAVFQSPVQDILQKSIQHVFQPIAVQGMGLEQRFFVVAQQSPRSWMSLASVRQSGSGQASTAIRLTARPAASQQSQPLEFGDPDMHVQFEQALKVASCQVPMLLQGEVGTGKEWYARALHRQSGHAGAPFVLLDCLELHHDPPTEEISLGGPDDMRQRIQSRLEQAGPGILFLDKIDELPAAAQTVLLGLLDQADAEGGQRPLLIASSSRRMMELVARGDFRADLYYRLSGWELILPPLRERRAMPRLLKSILRQEACPPRLSAQAEQLLLDYDWPGNLRQLSHVLRVMVASAGTGQMLGKEHVPAHLRQGATPAAAQPAPGGEAERVAAQSAGMAQSAVLPEHEAPAVVAGLNSLELTERATLLRLLDENRWNISQVSKRLGLSRNTLYRKMHRLQIPLRTD